MPKGDPNGGRPRRIEKASEDRLRAVLVETGHSPRRVLPRLVPNVVESRDRLLSEALARNPASDPVLLRSTVEMVAVEAAVQGLRDAHRLKNDPKVADAFQRWLDGGELP